MPGKITASVLLVISFTVLSGHIPKEPQNLAAGVRESSRESTIANGSILTIWTRLRSSIPGALTHASGQVLRFFGYVGNNPPYPIAETPQLPLEVYANEFADILGTDPQLVHIAKGFGFTEGPVYVSVKDRDEGYFLFTDQINDNILILRWYGLDPYNKITPLSWSQPVVYRHPSSIADGQTVDLQGRLLTAETTGRRISRTELDGTVKTLIGFYQGKPLNSPNDLVVKSDGTVWFTDPGYGCLQFPQECYLPNNVYRFDPNTNALDVVIGDLKMPNGIAFSPDERILYVIDSAAIQAPRTYYEKNPHAIYAYDVSAEGAKLENKRLFATVSPGFPDGMRLDASGNIYVGALDGVHVFNPKGELIGKILMPKETANLTFGGGDNNILFYLFFRFCLGY